MRSRPPCRPANRICKAVPGSPRLTQPLSPRRLIAKRVLPPLCRPRRRPLLALSLSLSRVIAKPSPSRVIAKPICSSLSPPSKRSSSPRAAFTSEATDRETSPAPTLPVRRPSSTRAVFTPEVLDREARPAPTLPSRRSASSRAVFISEPVDREAGPIPVSPSLLPPPLRTAASSEVPAREADSSQLVEALRWLQLSSLELSSTLTKSTRK